MNSAVLINNAAVAATTAAAPAFRRRAAATKSGSLVTSRRRGETLTVRADDEDAAAAAAVASGEPIWMDEDSRNDISESAGFEQDFFFNLGGATPAPLKAVRFATGSTPVVVTVPRPLGIVFEEKADGIYNRIVVDEIIEGSNAAKADIKVGDVLRITTAVFNVPGVIDVTAWLNPPKSTNCKAFFVADQEPFDKVMSAIQSHAVPVDTPDGPVEVTEVGLVLERKAAA